MKKLESFDGLRGFGALTLVLYHYYCVLSEVNSENVAFYNLLKWAYNDGSLCVELFFMLSGFLMAYGYKGKISEMSFVEYLKRRVPKIWVCGVVSIILTALYVIFDRILTDGTTFSFAIDFWTIYVAVLLIPIGWAENTVVPYVNWFIPVLLLNYILFFIIVKLKNKFKSNDLYIILSICVFFLGWTRMYDVTYEPAFLNWFDGRGYAGFFGGVLLYEITGVISEKKAKNLSIINGMLLVFLLVLACFFGKWAVLGNVNLVVPFFVWPTVILCSLYIRPVKRILSTRVCAFFSRISMGLYLGQGFVFSMVKILNIHFGWQLNFKSVIVWGCVLGLVILQAIIWNVFVDNYLVKKVQILINSN